MLKGLLLIKKVLNQISCYVVWSHFQNWLSFLIDVTFPVAKQKQLQKTHLASNHRRQNQLGVCFKPEGWFVLILTAVTMAKEFGDMIGWRHLFTRPTAGVGGGNNNPTLFPAALLLLMLFHLLDWSCGPAAHRQPWSWHSLEPRLSHRKKAKKGRLSMEQRT